jgi:hypothetical protein
MSSVPSAHQARFRTDHEAVSDADDDDTVSGSIGTGAVSVAHRYTHSPPPSSSSSSTTTTTTTMPSSFSYSQQHSASNYHSTPLRATAAVSPPSHSHSRSHSHNFSQSPYASPHHARRSVSALVSPASSERSLHVRSPSASVARRSMSGRWSTASTPRRRKGRSMSGRLHAPLTVAVAVAATAADASDAGDSSATSNGQSNVKSSASAVNSDEDDHVVQKQYGYSWDSLVEKAQDPSIACGMCGLVARDAVGISVCSHIFCNLCVRDMMKQRYQRFTGFACPVCFQAFKRHMVKPAPCRIVINNLKCTCPKCNFTVRIGELPRHRVAKCGARQVNCRVCGEDLPAAELDAHMHLNADTHIDMLMQQNAMLKSTLSDQRDELKQNRLQLKDRMETIRRITGVLQNLQALYDEAVRENRDQRQLIRQLSRASKSASIVAATAHITRTDTAASTNTSGEVLLKSSGSSDELARRSSSFDLSAGSRSNGNLSALSTDVAEYHTKSKRIAARRKSLPSNHARHSKLKHSTSRSSHPSSESVIAEEESDHSRDGDSKMHDKNRSAVSEPATSASTHSNSNSNSNSKSSLQTPDAMTATSIVNKAQVSVQWDAKCKHGLVLLSKDRHLCTNRAGIAAKSAGLKQVWSAGKHSFSVRITGSATIGIAFADWSRWSVGGRLGRVIPGWAIDTDGHVYRRLSENAQPEQFLLMNEGMNAGDIVTICVDLDIGEMSVCLNGTEDLGVVFDDLVIGAAVRGAVSLHVQGDSIALVPNPSQQLGDN